MDSNVMNQKMQELLEDKEFMDFLLAQDTYEKIQVAFASKEIELTLEEVKAIVSAVLLQMNKDDSELDEGDLENVAGGVVLSMAAIVGIAKIATAMAITVAGCVIGWKLAGK